jgi:hypothetical protein
MDSSESDSDNDEWTTFDPFNDRLLSKRLTCGKIIYDIERQEYLFDADTKEDESVPSYYWTIPKDDIIPLIQALEEAFDGIRSGKFDPVVTSSSSPSSFLPPLPPIWSSSEVVHQRQINFSYNFCGRASLSCVTVRRINNAALVVEGCRYFHTTASCYYETLRLSSTPLPPFSNRWVTHNTDFQFFLCDVAKLKSFLCSVDTYCC